MTAIWLVKPQLCTLWCLQRRLQSSGPERRPGAWPGTGPSACLSSLSCTQTHTCDEAVQKVRLRQSWYVTAGVGDACRCRFVVPLPHPRPPRVDRQEFPPPTAGTAGGTFTRWTSCLLSWFGDRCSLLTIQGCLRT